MTKEYKGAVLGRMPTLNCIIPPMSRIKSLSLDKKGHGDHHHTITITERRIVASFVCFCNVGKLD